MAHLNFVSGVILYELYVGERFAMLYPSGLLSHTPVQFDECELLEERRWRHNTVELPPSKKEQFFEESLQNLIINFLKPLPDDRLCEEEKIKNHSFFKGIDWDNLKHLA